MAQTKYTYSIATDTANAKLANSKLKSEVQASAIVTAIDYINSLGDVLDIYMKDVLSAGDETVLDGVVAAHDGVPIIEIPTVDLASKTSVSKIPKVAIHKSEGNSTSISSHDWTDPCTWYTESVRVVGETLDLDTGKTYLMDHVNIIDLVHGRVSDEDDFSATYLVKVYDNAVEKTEDTDFTVDYENAKVIFDAGYTVTGPVTCDYSYENGSMYKLAPLSGKILSLEHAELQFSSDISMNNSFIDFEIWVYNPYDLPNKIMYKIKRYKNMKDILNSANLGQGKIQPIAGMTNDILVFPFNYVTVQNLLSSQGAELRISINNDAPFGGEWGTATFYITSESE